MRLEKNRWHLICTIVFMVWPALVQSESTYAVVGSHADKTIGEFGQRVQFSQEPVAGWTPLEAHTKLLDAPFYTSDELNFGYQERPHWLKFEFHNPSPETRRWVLMTMRTSLELLEIYRVDHDRIQLLFDNADTQQRVDAYERHFGLAADIVMPPNARTEILLRFRASASGWLPMVLVPETLTTSVLVGRVFLSLFCAAAVITLLAANFLYFLFTRRAVFGWYCLASLGILLGGAHLQGATTLLFFGENPADGRIFGSLAMVTSTVFLMVFAGKFLRMPDGLWPPFGRIYQALIWVGSSYIAFLLSLRFATAVNPDPYVVFGWGFSIFVLFFLPAHALWAYRNGQSSAWPLLLSWFLYLTFTAATVLSTAGLIEPISAHWLLLGPTVVLETALMTLALALQVRTDDVERLKLRDDRERALDELANNARMVLAIGHDSRNMLAGIELLGRELERSGTSDSSVSKQITTLSSTVANMLSLLIDESRSGTLESPAEAIEEIELEQLFSAILILAQAKLQASGTQLEFRSQVTVFAADRTILLRTLLNLVDNAIKYGTGNRILVAVRERHDAILFEVWNTGSGLSATDIKGLLKTVNHGRGFIRSDQSGIGSGLSVVVKLLNKSNGILYGSSDSDGATVFGVRIPHVDLSAIRRLSISVLGPDSDVKVVSGLLEELKVEYTDHPDADIHILIADQSMPELAPKRQRRLIATYDRGREFRRTWQKDADVFVYLPAMHDSLLRALSSAGTS
ncbi:MAG: hypothetical protein GKR90_16225 [Pseudomonadales bacterium]|nr:hypothetical protein [Pseudomonadales bacterium]